MKIKKSKSLDKQIVAELRESFFKNDKMYDNYLIGTITYKNNQYDLVPTESDDAFTEDQKTTILNHILNDSVYMPGKEGKGVEKTKDDPEYLYVHAKFRTNMYGGLYIVDSSESEKKSAELSDTGEEQPEKEPDLIITKNKKLSE